MPRPQQQMLQSGISLNRSTFLFFLGSQANHCLFHCWSTIKPVSALRITQCQVLVQDTYVYVNSASVTMLKVEKYDHTGLPAHTMSLTTSPNHWRRHCFDVCLVPLAWQTTEGQNHFPSCLFRSTNPSVPKATQRNFVSTQDKMSQRGKSMRQCRISRLRLPGFTTICVRGSFLQAM